MFANIFRSEHNSKSMRAVATIVIIYNYIIKHSTIALLCADVLQTIADSYKLHFYHLGGFLLAKLRFLLQAKMQN